MPETELATAIAQFGVAGLIGWMWLTERRAAATRERQLTEAHDRLADDRIQLGALLASLDRNTRALAAIEHGQRRLAEALDRMATPRPVAPPAAPFPDHPPATAATDPTGGTPTQAADRRPRRRRAA